ncbi:MAG TPA: response regulator [Candidatus Thermoplasmatota archaeon]|nr:response regulator [Candidatus Thermoplasmatota archaeon]
MSDATRPTRVLVVDDEPAILRSTAYILKDLGYDVYTCGEAREILSVARDATPDVVLQDVRMPGLDLERTVTALRSEAQRELRLILFTASLEGEELAERLHADAFIPKPFRPAELVEALGPAERAGAPAGGGPTGQPQ